MCLLGNSVEANKFRMNLRKRGLKGICLTLQFHIVSPSKLYFQRDHYVSLTPISPIEANKLRLS